MKAISLLQPWASLAAMGHKQFETRSWQTKHRGPLLIHASVGKSGMKFITPEMWDYFIELGFNVDTLPYGAIIGQVNLISIHSTNALNPHSAGTSLFAQTEKVEAIEITKKEKAFGDYSSDRFAWLLSDPVLFETPIPTKGKLSIWQYDQDIEVGDNVFILNGNYKDSFANNGIVKVDENLLSLFQAGKVQMVKQPK